MLNINEYKDYPLYKSLIELNSAMEKENIPPIELSVVGGFAMMVKGYRDNDGITDIDYIGEDLPEVVKKMSQKIGIQNGLVKDWLNNDLMLTGSTFEDLEFSTGKLHFDRAFDMSKIKVDIIDTKDLLRMKVIAIDTALSAIDFGGEFTRMKDFADIVKLMEATKTGYAKLNEECRDYIINPGTIKYINYYEKHGYDKMYEHIKAKQLKIMQRMYGNIGDDVR